jgi:hypothetical protein
MNLPRNTEAVIDRLLATAVEIKDRSDSHGEALSEILGDHRELKTSVHPIFISLELTITRLIGLQFSQVIIEPIETLFPEFAILFDPV